MSTNFAGSLVAALTLLAGSATPGIAQVRVPGPLPPTKHVLAQLDPLELPTPRCIVDDATQYAHLDLSQVGAKRRLQRSNPMAPGGASPTSIRALVAGSQHWTTKCPVRLTSQQVVNQGNVCKPISVIVPAGGTSQLKIARQGSAFVFKIENSVPATIRGSLTPVRNPHGPNEIVWLKSSNVTINGTPSNQYDFYFYLQDDNGLKYYLAEVFDRTDAKCLNEHLPGANTLCRNPDDGSPCVLGRRRAESAHSAATSRASLQAPAGVGATSVNAAKPASTAAWSKPGKGGKKKEKQGETGGGHEPIER